MDQEEKQGAPMTRSERIAQRKAAREELLEQMALKKKKAVRIALFVGVPLAIIAAVIVILSFSAGTRIGKKTDWKAGDSFTFAETWDKILPPKTLAGKAQVLKSGKSKISGACKVLEAASGQPTKLEITVESFEVVGRTDVPENLPSKFSLTATRSGPDAEWMYEPELHELCPLRADFLLTCGLDLPYRKWSERAETNHTPPRWATPSFPAPDMPKVINYTCKGGSETIEFKIAQHSFERFVPGKVTIDGKNYQWHFIVDGNAQFNVAHNFVTNFYYKPQGSVIAYVTTDSRRKQNEPAPGFGIVSVSAKREWK